MPTDYAANFRCRPVAREGRFAWFLAIAVTCTVPLLTWQQACGQNGKAIFQAQCADCHGDQGQGVEGVYDQKLQGVLTLYELENYISETMPEGDAKACQGPDAKAVAQYVYDEFYSLAAQNRRNPPKYIFSRLTAEQYRNSVVDMLASFTKRRENLPGEHGLKATYFNSRSMKDENKVNERIDPTIDFDFGEGAPEKVEGQEFAIRWQGSLIAAESGEYEFIVESSNSVRVNLNSWRTPLVDANVVSGDRAEYRAKVHLLQGRTYYISVDLRRFKEKHGFVRLSWVRPNGTREVIPANHFCTDWSAPLPLLELRFPPDDQSYGYPRGISVSKQWSEAVSSAAIEAGQYVSKNLDEFVKPEPDSDQRRQLAREFCQQLATIAFRQPLSPDLQKLYIETSFSDHQLSLQEATKRSVVLILKSPRFLYVDLAVDEASGRPQDPPAFTLARVLWDSVPERELREAEKAGRLVDDNAIDGLLDRMLRDPRARTKLENFFRHYLKLDALHSLEKDEQLYAGFDSALAHDLERSLQIQLDELLWKDGAALPELFATEVLYANPRILEFYGLAVPDGEVRRVGDFVRVPANNRIGILSHPLLLAGFAYRDSSSPIHRGVFLAQNIIGRRLNPPPDAFPPFDGEIAKTWTTREKVSYQTKPISCQRCHGLINSLGFAFEAYDAAGRRRTTDNQKPVDSSGKYRTADGKLVEYQTAEELIRFLADSPDVHRHFVEELFQFLVKQPVAVYGEQASDRLMNRFRESRYDVRGLIKEIAKIAAFLPPSR